MIDFRSSWDDGGGSDIRIAELMAKYDIQSIFYWPANWQKVNALRNRTALSMDQAREIASKFEIGSHGVNHELLTKVTPEIVYKEIFNSKDALEDLFQKSITSFCYPRGYFNNDIKGMVEKAGYTEGRTVKVGVLDVVDDPYETPTTVHVGYNRKEYDGKTWLEYGKKMLDEAVERSLRGEKVVYHFWGHAYEMDKYNAWSDLYVLLQLISMARDEDKSS